MIYSGCWNGIAIVAIGVFAALALVAVTRRLFPADEPHGGRDHLKHPIWSMTKPPPLLSPQHFRLLRHHHPPPEPHHQKLLVARHCHGERNVG